LEFYSIYYGTIDKFGYLILIKDFQLFEFNKH